MKALVFQRMDRIFHATVIKAISYGAHEGRRSEAAGAAEIGFVWVIQRIAAAGAGRAGQGGNFSPAGIADWHRGEPRQEGAAERAGGRKKGAAECLHWTSEHANHCTPTRGLRWRKIERQ